MTHHAIYIAGWLTLSPVAVIALWSVARDLRVAFRVFAPLLLPLRDRLRSFVAAVRVLFPSALPSSPDAEPSPRATGSGARLTSEVAW